jgi:hypothetical protein
LPIGARRHNSKEKKEEEEEEEEKKEMERGGIEFFDVVFVRAVVFGGNQAARSLLEFI